MVEEKGLSDKWHIDSAATGDYHIGSRPDKRALDTLTRHKVATSHKCRLLKKRDFTDFDVIFGMDDANMSDLEDMAPSGSTALLKRLGEYDPEKELTIQDPYYGGDSGFETVYQQSVRCCKGYLEANL